MHLGLNIANDIFDTRAEPTRPTSTRRRSAAARASSSTACVAAADGAARAAFYAVGVGIGVFLAATRGWWLLWLGAAGVAVSLAYTAPPFRLVHRGLGEIAVALGFGPIMTLGAYYVSAQRVELEALYISLPVGDPDRARPLREQIPDRGGDARPASARCPCAGRGGGHHRLQARPWPPRSC